MHLIDYALRCVRADGRWRLTAQRSSRVALRGSTGGLAEIIAILYALAAFGIASLVEAVALAGIVVLLLAVSLAVPRDLSLRVAPTLAVLLLIARLAAGVHAVPPLASAATLADDLLVTVSVPFALAGLRNELVPRRIQYGLVLLLLAPLAGVIGAHEQGIAARAILLGLWLTVKPVIAFALGIIALGTHADHDAFRRRLGRLGGLIAGIGLLEFVVPVVVHRITLPQDRLERSGVTVVRSLFSGPQDYGFYMILIGAVLWLAPTRSSRGQNGVLFLVLSLLSLRLKTLSEFGLVLALAAMLAERGRRTVMFAGGVLVAGIVLATAGPVLISVLHQQEATYFTPDSHTPRQELYQTGISIAKQHFPLGTGVGSFGTHASIKYRSPVYAEYGLDDAYGFGLNGPLYALDTSWPPALAENGALGVLLLVVGAILIMFGRRGNYFYGASLRWAILGAVLIDSAASARLYDPLAMVILGLVWAPRHSPLAHAELSEAEDQPDEVSPAPGPVPRRRSPAPVA